MTRLVPKSESIAEISVIVIVVSGSSHLQTCLQALQSQQNCSPGRLEIIVPFDQTDREISDLKIKFPDVLFHPVVVSVRTLPGLCHDHFDHFRSVGLAIARGSIVAMLEDHAYPDSNWCNLLLKAHKKPVVAVGGAIENDIDKSVNWATFFFSCGRYQRPLKCGPSALVTDTNVAYKRETMDAIKPSWQHRFHEPTVHSRLLSKGETFWLSPDIIVYQHRKGLKLVQSLKERYWWGRHFSANRFDTPNRLYRFGLTLMSIAAPLIIFAKMSKTAIEKKRNGKKFIVALPITVLLIFAWSFGEMMGYITGRCYEVDDSN